MQKNEKKEDYSCRTCKSPEYSKKEDPAKNVWKSNRAVRNWISGVLLGIGIFLTFLFEQHNMTLIILRGEGFVLSDFLLLLSIGIGGKTILKNGYFSLKKRNLSISLLMSFAILGSIIVSFIGGKHLYLEGATLAFLFNLSELLENYSIEKARGSLVELMDLSPNTATTRRNGEEVEVPIEEVKKDDLVLVRPGEKIPVDGIVVEGDSSVNQAPITGESIPVDKGNGDEVYAGTINEQGYLEIEASRKGTESTLFKIVELVKGAQSEKTEREKFIERFSSQYTKIVILIAILVALLPPLLFNEAWITWFVRGITMLVLACPCAFVISTPVTVVSGITSAARNGVLIEGGRNLETMGEIDLIAFDKTGTLTEGELRVTDVIPLNGMSEKELIRCACGVEERSEHPVAEAIVNHGEENHDISHKHEIEDFKEFSGKGVKATLRGKKHYAGKPSFLEELGFDITHVHHSSNSEKIKEEASHLCRKGNCLNLVNETIPRLQKEGKTVILVTAKDQLEGIIAVSDKIRDEAKKVIEDFQKKGIKTVMLTGDNEETAETISETVGIDEYHSELLPDEKVKILKNFSQEDDKVGMVGDGINDAPALAAADVGIVMGAAGADTALETADIALMENDLTKLPYLYNMALKANGIIRENIFSSLGVKILLAFGVPLGYVPIALAVLAGDAGMTLGVTGNAMRLSRVESEDL